MLWCLLHLGQCGSCVKACGCVHVRGLNVCVSAAGPGAVACVCCVWTVCCRYVSALRTAAASAGKQMVGFERYLRLRSKGGNHTHINTLPISECLLGPVMCLAAAAAASFRRSVRLSIAGRHNWE